MKDLATVGGKNASLGEMMHALKNEGIPVPQGFSTTADAYQETLRKNDMEPNIRSLLEELKQERSPLHEVGASIRELFMTARFPAGLTEEIRRAYQELCRLKGREDLEVAVRSSATAEDLPEASFAGMLESYLNVRGVEQLMDACQLCFASLFTDRAIRYRENMGFDHMKISLCVGVQEMVRADLAGAGVIFSIDKRTGFPGLILISAAWGLGENVVQGMVIPDEYRVFKPLLGEGKALPIVEKSLGAKEKRRVYAADEKGGTVDVKTGEKERTSFVLQDEAIVKLARWACAIEDHYGRPMDMEWAKDGLTEELYIVQARPVTGQPLEAPGSVTVTRLKEKKKPLLKGLSIGEGISTGKVSFVQSFKKIDRLADSAILVSESANTGWVSAMKTKHTKGLVTDFGGRNSHGAIACRELGIPGILGTLEATQVLKDGQEVTVSSVEGDDGFVYDGIMDHEAEEFDLRDIPETRMTVMMSVASEAAAFQWWRLPCSGIGLARMDFIFHHIIQVHPMALLHLDRVKDRKAFHEIQMLTQGYEDKAAYFVDHLSYCLAQIAASRYPDPVLVRLSDFETPEYASLKGGRDFEPTNSAASFGLRGVSRYLSDHYRPGFELECRAVKGVREAIGLTNVGLVIPYCRNVEEADEVLALLREQGLDRKEKGCRIYLSCDYPSNVADAESLAGRFDGFSVAAQNLRSLIPGSPGGDLRGAEPGDPANTPLKDLLKHLMEVCHGRGGTLTVRGRTFRRSRNLVRLLFETGVDAVSVNPEGIPSLKKWIAGAEKAAA
jgi:pyruvate,water dikinase